jgi:hypothetical protein
VAGPHEGTHSLYTHCTLIVHSLYTHCTLIVHSLYTHYTLDRMKGYDAHIDDTAALTLALSNVTLGTVYS